MALPTADLNVVAVHRIKANFQRVQAGTFTLADFQTLQIIGRAVSQRAPLIQLFVIARCDNTTVAYQHRRCVDDCSLQQIAQLGKLAHLLT
ncbi:Uncharacterised protein [Shigella sonnei]|jgi:hypothetical protein|nr:Uncharacterised protein [Shigella sonnei]CSF11359.1 Uncharacterised protein [Shigella sonnei]CSF39593.1 Uncharacterised protein [Shigella sonnei]CSF76707.1 Uncharacterised protein [Shigella sonnei]CSF84608.1 Uncharacterised protein [Shigella sonnei]